MTHEDFLPNIEIDELVKCYPVAAKKRYKKGFCLK